MLANATRRWQPCFLRYSLTGDRFCCALENYSFGKVQDSRDVRCVRLEIFVADQSSGTVSSWTSLAIFQSTPEPLKYPTSRGEIWSRFITGFQSEEEW